MFVYNVYYALTSVLNAYMPSLLKSRLAKGKENPERFQEKLGFYSVERPKGKLIWFHTASVGELNSIIPLINELDRAKNKILVTTVTLNASRLFEKHKFKNVTHQFAPVDTPQAVRRFLTHWQPSIGIFIDSELWPNLLTMASEKCKLINLNARLSDKSAHKWSIFKSCAKYLYSKFSLVLPCSKDDMRKISQFLHSSKLKYIGNLKIAAAQLSFDDSEQKAIKKELKGKKVIVAASTHAGEEAVILGAYKEVSKKHKNLILVIAPRHPDRGDAIAEEASLFGYDAPIRGKEQKISKTSPVYIANTIGEMGLWYSVADIAIVGGAFIPHGGHNIIEPAKFGIPVITGKHYHNFRDVVSHFETNDAVLIAGDQRELQTHLNKLLVNKNAYEKYAENVVKASEADDILTQAINIITKRF